MTGPRELTERQQLFVTEYAIHGNAAAAARAAGYSDAVARQTAHKLLLKPHVALELRRQTATLVEAHVPNAVATLSELMNDPEVGARDRIRAAEVLLKHSRPGGPSVAVQVNVAAARSEAQSIIQEVWAAKEARELTLLNRLAYDSAC